MILVSTRSFVGHSQSHFQFGANLAYARKIKIKRKVAAAVYHNKKNIYSLQYANFGTKRLIMNFNDVFRNELEKINWVLPKKVDRSLKEPLTHSIGGLTLQRTFCN